MSACEPTLLSLFQIGISIHHLNKKSEKQLGLSLVQWCILRHLIDMPEATAFALSKSVGVHPSTLTQTLKRLERKKHIFVMEDPKDSRRKLVSITRNGRDVLLFAGKRMESWAQSLSKFESDIKNLKLELNGQIGKDL